MPPRNPAVPKTLALPSLPFFACEACHVQHWEKRTTTISISVPLGQMSQATVNNLVVRRLLHKRYRRSEDFPDAPQEEVTAADDELDALLDDVDSAPAGSQRTKTSCPMVVDILSVDADRTNVSQDERRQIRLKLHVEFVTAVITPGVCAGGALAAPYENTMRLRLGSGEEVLAQCNADEPIQVGQACLVIAEPSCIRLLAFRPPRTSRGQFQKVPVPEEAKIELRFTPDEGSWEALEMAGQKKKKRRHD